LNKKALTTLLKIILKNNNNKPQSLLETSLYFYRIFELFLQQFYYRKSLILQKPLLTDPKNSSKIKEPSNRWVKSKVMYWARFRRNEQVSAKVPE